MLIEDWCQQYPSHSVGGLAFGADGALYVSGGDGASFNFADWGQDGSPLNPCGDPPGGVGATLTPPTAEGGALRSQDLRTTADPARSTGPSSASTRRPAPACPDNPLAFSSRPERAPDRRVRLPQPVPVHASGRTRTRSGSATSAGTPGRRSTGSMHRRRRRELRLAVLRGRRAPVRLRRRQPEHLREPVRRRPGAVTAPYYTYNHSARWCRARPARPAARRLRASRSTRRATTRELRRRAVLRRLLARLHLGDAGRHGRVAEPGRVG